VAEYPHVWTLSRRPAGRKGQRCRIIGKGKIPETCNVEFQDGRRFVVLRKGLEKKLAGQRGWESAPRRQVMDRRPWPGVQLDDGRKADYAQLECGHGVAIPHDYVDDGTVPCGECA
jgi:hypothetical protein